MKLPVCGFVIKALPLPASFKFRIWKVSGRPSGLFASSLPLTAVFICVVSVPFKAVGGVSIYVKFMGLVAIPPGVITDTWPVEAAAGTVAVIWLAELITKFAGTPLKRTEVAPASLKPVMVTLVPTGPLAGEMRLIIGGASPIVSV